jgi:pyocin large subunit-like protein
MGTGRGGQYSRTRGADGPASCGGRIRATDFLPGKLEEHVTRHKTEFGDGIDEKEYLRLARKFFDKPVTSDILWFEDVDGFLYKYDKKRNEFGICSPDGPIITYFKPTRGINYWYDQREENGK